MNETKTIDKTLPPTPFRLLEGDTTTATLKIKAPQDLTIRVMAKAAQGLVVFSLKRPKTVVRDPMVIELPSGKPYRVPAPPHAGRTPLPHAVELDGDKGTVFVLDGLYAGDCITIGKGLKQGEAWVEVAGIVPATPEKCKAYNETLGMQITPHPVWGLPSLG